ncbi:MAG: flagellar protein [Halanaerobiales bacterium]|nr:flagellar protein [Halanaerobiales bacterium]
MDQRIYINSVQPLHRSTKIQTKNTSGQSRVPFSEILKEQVQSHSIRFSKHAEQRLKTRKIQLDQGKIDKLSKAIDQAEEKGSRESLVLMDNVAYVVSVKNRLVITAVNDENLKDNVFTNIDSAVVV